MSLADLGAMLDTCQRRRFYGARDRALMLFLLDSGLRRAEFQALDVGHVNLDNGSVVVIRGKGGSGLRRPADSHSGRCRIVVAPDGLRLRPVPGRQQRVPRYRRCGRALSLPSREKHRTLAHVRPAVLASRRTQQGWASPRPAAAPRRRGRGAR